MSQNVNLEKIDADYENRMIAFEINCNDGIGDGMSCHQVGEFLSVVKDDHAKAAKVYEKNCWSKNYGPSCFNLGRFHRKDNPSIYIIIICYSQATCFVQCLEEVFH